MADENKKNEDIEELGSDLNIFFDNFIKEGSVVEEREIVKDFKIKIKVLNTGDLIAAEAIMNNSSTPSDIVAKVRACSILSQAIVSLNGNPIEKETYTSDQIRKRRIILYRDLLKIPSIVIHKSYEFYIECVQKQNNFYTDTKETINKIQNF